MNKRVITSAEQKQLETQLGRATKHVLSKAVREITPQLKAVSLELFNEAVVLIQDFDKDQRNVLKKQLVDMLVEATTLGVFNELIQTEVTPQPVEASLKPAKKQAVKKQPEVVYPVNEEPEEEDPLNQEPEDKPKTKAKAKAKAKPEPKKELVETLEPEMTVGIDRLPMVKVFPKEIDHEELGKLIAVPDKFTDYESLVTALEEGKTIYFVSYWTKRQLKEYSYAHWKQIDPKVVAKGFPMNLDILMAVLPCETMERVFAMSRLTEALFQFEGEDLEPVVDESPDGEKYQVRVSAGMEFQLYVPSAEVK